ncbi:DMT family transporter [Geobacillus sp. BMUD]|uniref:DMT family transporter n=1 Tax=Geobacillus sp. BMUD TaxID=2508876 RepID=UPI001492CB60|nr:DMT family transporter [Geobacillus sp. BMUD]NNU84571.1 DMT family transporter [Geobacillus sp. BMUD]
MKWLWMTMALAAGMAVSVQAGVNGGLGRRVGVLEGAFVSFFIGTIVLFFVQLFFGKGELLAMFSVPKWQLTGGILGAFYVFVMVLIVPKIGVANSLMAVIAGQLVMSSIVDHFGLFGGQRIPFDWTRFAAMGFLFLALWLFFRK